MGFFFFGYTCIMDKCDQGFMFINVLFLAKNLNVTEPWMPADHSNSKHDSRNLCKKCSRNKMM